jgi:hypothetical protein
MEKTIEEYKIQSARIEASATAHQEIISMIDKGVSIKNIRMHCNFMITALLQQINVLNKELDKKLNIELKKS